MDPLTHGLLGGCAAQLGLRRRADLPLAAAGLFGGLAPDLDLLIRSSQDPILPWVMHRQFSHSLLFIPLGGLFVSLILWIFYRRHYRFGWIYLAATLGYATHGLLDAATSYGTLLYWPFSNNRIFWDVLPIVDPVFSLLLLAGFVGSLWRRSAIPALVALSCIGAYTFLGYHQHQRGLQAQERLIQGRGHAVSHRRVMPTVGNILVWRSLYEDSRTGRLYADGFRLSLPGNEMIWEGESGEKFQRGPLTQRIPSGSELDRDLNRLRWFADDFLIWVDEELGVIGDARFSSELAGLKPFWGVRAYWDHPDHPVQRLRFSFSLGESLRELWNEIRGRPPPPPRPAGGQGG